MLQCNLCPGSFETNLKLDCQKVPLNALLWCFDIAPRNQIQVDKYFAREACVVSRRTACEAGNPFSADHRPSTPLPFRPTRIFSRSSFLGIAQCQIAPCEKGVWILLWKTRVFESRDTKSRFYLGPGLHTLGLNCDRRKVWGRCRRHW